MGAPTYKNYVQKKKDEGVPQSKIWSEEEWGKAKASAARVARRYAARKLQFER